MIEIVMARLQWSRRRLLAAAICLIVRGEWAYCAWTADPGSGTWTADGRMYKLSTAKEIEVLRLMVYP
jgi:hypothetical protein